MAAGAWRTAALATAATCLAPVHITQLAALEQQVLQWAVQQLLLLRLVVVDMLLQPHTGVVPPLGMRLVSRT